MRNKRKIVLLLVLGLLLSNVGPMNVNAQMISEEPVVEAVEETEAAEETEVAEETEAAEETEETEAAEETEVAEETEAAEETEVAEETEAAETEAIEESVEESKSELSIEQKFAAAFESSKPEKDPKTGYEPLHTICVEEEDLEEWSAGQAVEEASLYAESKLVNFNRSNYFYNQLSYYERLFYDNLVSRSEYLYNSNASLTYFNSSISYYNQIIYYTGLSYEEAEDVYYIFQYTNPKYFFLYNGFVYNYNRGGIFLTTYSLFGNGNTRLNVRNQMEAKLNSWIATVNGEKGAYRKEQKIYNLMCQNISYEFGTYDQTMYSALLLGRTVCAGYSKLFTVLCNAVGIETMGVTSNDHAWNLVYLYGKWYNVDVTNGDRGSTGSMNYFNISDSLISSGSQGYHWYRESHWNGISPSAPYTYLPFDDVNERSGWRYDAINLVYGSGIMGAVGQTNNFLPDELLTRAMFATMIHRIQGRPSATYYPIFPDVPNGNYYSVPIMWTSQTGIMKGHSNTGLFGTFENITREDMVVVMYRYAASCGCNMSGYNNLAQFPDNYTVSGYARTAMGWAVANGIITGRSNTGMLDPKGNATRVECAAVIQRFLQKYMSNKIK